MPKHETLNSTEPQKTMNIYTKHGIIHHDPETAPDESMLYLGTPSHTVTPYDTYARMLEDDARKCFRRAGIAATVVSCHRRIASPIGSGPGGSRRFGDDMLPPDVQAVVKTSDIETARDAWEEWTFRRSVSRPVSIAGNLTWNGTAWTRGGVWPATIANALALCLALRRNPARLIAYANRHGLNVRPTL